MKLAQRLAALDRLQHARSFKIIASIVVIAIAAIGFGAFVVSVTSGPGGVPTLDIPQGINPAVAEQMARQRELLLDIVTASDPIAGVGIGVAALVALSLGAIWLGLGLSYFAAFAGVGVLWLISLVFPSLARPALLIGGMVVLVQAFVALLAALRIVLSGSNPILAVAQNVLAEAVRLKLSLIFIVMLIVLLAAMPLMLDADQPLRYRVQAFLQWSTGGSFWIIAVLVVFFSVGTVAFEQRDKVIWQTMTKPVAAWKYLLGKWLGVVTLAAVLLAVSSTGVFLFTEYLRTQPALGETSAADRHDPTRITEDRLILETQVLTARRSYTPVPAGQLFEGFDLNGALKARVAAEQRQRPDFRPTQKDLNSFRREIYEAFSISYRSIEPRERFEDFVFAGLGDARKSNKPLTLRYRIDAEGNRPDMIYKLSFQFTNGMEITGRRTGLGMSHTLTFSPAAIGDDGVLHLRIYNGDLSPVEQGQRAFSPNPASITFPGDGLTISHAVGSYRTNFVRVAMVLWIKLAFLAAIGVSAATFLSFPIAALVTIGIFFMAESSGFLMDSLAMMGTTDHDGNTQYWKIVSTAITQVVTRLFTVYTELKPTSRLADGRLLGWGEVARGTIALVGSSVVLFIGGVLIFRRRELATYSGQ